MANVYSVTHTAHTPQHATAAGAHDARPHCRLKSPFLRIPANIAIVFILPETRVPELHEGCCGIGLPVYLLLRNSFRKPRNGVQDEL